MSLIADGVRVTRDTVEEAVEKIALACCRGVIQHSLITELIEEGGLRKRLQPITLAGHYDENGNWTKGEKTLAWGYGKKNRNISKYSWNNLVQRLEHAGFYFDQVDGDKNGDHTVVMYWKPYEGRKV